MRKEIMLPAWAGIRSFMRAPIVSEEDVKAGELAVVGVPYESTGGSRPGAKYGPAGIREESLLLDYYRRSAESGTLVDLDWPEDIFHLPGRLVDLGDVPVYPTDVTQTSEAISNTIGTIIKRGARPIVFGGDHYITYPVVRGVVQAAREISTKRCGYIQIDGHLDLAKSSQIWGSHYHGSNARLICDTGLINPSNMVIMGLRGYCRGEQLAYAREQGINLMTWREIQRVGVKQAAEKALNLAAKNVDGVYLSIDIDGADPAYAPGCGTVTMGGLTGHELLEAVRIIGQGSLVGLDVVEVAPQWDVARITCRLAAMCVVKALASSRPAER